MNWIRIGTILGATGVAIGAFGAHGLPGWLESTGLDAEVMAKRIESFQTGVRYQLVHALALLCVGILSKSNSSAWLQRSGYCFTLGVATFSGLLYALTLSGATALGIIVPIGGILMICGWVCLAVSDVGGTDGSH
jgi:uncharacterized membrane protein YgdD (TMEM256/DUF423 family)